MPSVALVDPAVAQVDGGHDRELVDGQRPRRLAGHGEDEPPRLAALDAVEDRGDLGGLRRSRERDGAGHGRRRNRADRDDEDVVGELRAVAEHDDSARGIHGLERRAHQFGALVAGERRKIDGRRAAEAERPADRRGPVDEASFGGEQRDAPPARRRRGAARAAPRSRRRRRRRSRSAVAPYGCCWSGPRRISRPMRAGRGRSR